MLSCTATAACLPTTSLARARRSHLHSRYSRVSCPVLARSTAPRQRKSSSSAEGAKAFKGPDVKKIEDWRVQKMTEMVHTYFDQMLSKCRVDLAGELLSPDCQHKDMVRDEERRGHDAMIKYLQDVHKAYPNFWARAEQVGVADDRTVFVAFEGQATERTPMFTGVDRVKFDKDLNKIVEVEIYRSNWQGAKGHEQRKQQQMSMRT